MKLLVAVDVYDDCTGPRINWQHVKTTRVELLRLVLF